MSGPAPLTVGTAGHVDHGKTTLVRALTGTDTDRLAEEKRRGLSIELGYAELGLPSGRRLSLVDVPGHERFVRTMVAGATGLDLFLLCVAADDGLMPQTREHCAVLRALDVRRGVVAVTKADLADPRRALAEVARLWPRLEAVPVAAPAGAGLAELAEALERAAGTCRPRERDERPARLHVDRSFSLRGIGTVVTGTLWSGRLATGTRVGLVPGGRIVRIRSVHVHDRPRESAAAGQRVAVALAGVHHSEVRRGDVICDQGTELRPSFVIDAALRLEPAARALESGTRVHVHHGTRDAPARVTVMDAGRLDSEAERLCRLRLEAPLIAEPGDRLVVRQVAPPDTIGGGTVIEPAARKSDRSPEYLARLRAALEGAPAPVTAREPAPVAVSEPPEVGAEALRLAAELEADGEQPRSDGDLERAAGLAGNAAAGAWRQLEAAGLAVRTGSSLHFHAASLECLAGRVMEIARRDGATTIAGVRDELGSSRRHAQAVLEHLDSRKLTVRQGDRHVLRRAAPPRGAR